MKDGEWYANRIIALQEQVGWLKSNLEHIRELGEMTREHSAEEMMYCVACNGIAQLEIMEREE